MSAPEEEWNPTPEWSVGLTPEMLASARQVAVSSRDYWSAQIVELNEMLVKAQAMRQQAEQSILIVDLGGQAIQAGITERAVARQQLVDLRARVVELESQLADPTPPTDEEDPF